ncbi:UTP--glucose-1-phosphate uridylyltransferase [Candidatus Roizmanbacteria bacterium RIFCSPLOWO2_02_FULL_37_19]|uniref:UTP--glucose-1-phosphate uridylyltransferase n=1 Tax=Candidatus Roizmanbacteria bacterium RIFCSPHIGHO2_02_FULL_37_24 TaxID=1802037 RepID=A0A1F7GWI7_9BACT|nr:MAG: UTP--glucose-1-phosphate uridylyltransferase [Candidatus Roizmanbacteria bacterium RIFCSPHIGHO2_01_FULL_38_41]OGK22946.1 MAG: UTP--glucose-1-phosphate uridylyltransferase [Candidatus Roizmanbacteria bacterium RIFCSPHIGHO2_02_FULL_37_24]OGK33600.1 MAG: UTP--glucose-1-phosphate uridylyltransferase [Candidatus Roizmanbacteria bacterium RIFCSPHIGHO2_12_FULL_37_23]OGK44195.1 MAG: UTP--glucose-1-phosphate uridylyltransferase [Candidatus Roizmanbacteria bacterium RIFCSPLOWO2_01_FULL_37_57]OGK5
MKKTITKVVIPAAGFGTRFLPQTKAMPKEMLPIVDKPVIQYVVEEAVSSGVKDIVIVTGSSKRPIEDHFDTPTEDLLRNLKQGNKENYIQEVNKIAEMANFIYIRQKGPYGNGTPVLSSEPIIGNESFAVMWGDEFIYAQPPRLKQMITAWQKFGGVMISGVRIEEKDYLSRYGIAEYEPVEDNVFKINRIVEKPKPDEAPSNLATHGAYILPPEIFQALKNLEPGKGGEIWLPDAINVLKNQGIPIYACEIQDGKYYDTGNKLEYMKTIVEFALTHKEINGEFRKFLKNLDI